MQAGPGTGEGTGVWVLWHHLAKKLDSCDQDEGIPTVLQEAQGHLEGLWPPRCVSEFSNALRTLGQWARPGISLFPR